MKEMRNGFFGVVFLFMAASCSNEKDYLVTIQTRHGDMYAILYDETPKHKENFIQLAQAGRFDSTEFHRVIPEFMIQGGDVFGKENLPPEQWHTIPAEFNPNLIHEKGSLSAARQGDNINPSKSSSGCQFYIVQGKVYDELSMNTDPRKLQDAFMKYLQLESNKELRDQYSRLFQQQEFDSLNSLMLSMKTDLEKFFSINLNQENPKRPNQINAYTTIGGTPHLDDAYTVFGKVIRGLEVLDKIAEEETGRGDKPLNPVIMNVEVKEVNKKKITLEYGYEYAK
jgi:peptidyl-prolyl cis-trans isomerase B (cyclophilin B)